MSSACCSGVIKSPQEISPYSIVLGPAVQQQTCFHVTGRMPLDATPGMACAGVGTDVHSAKAEFQSLRRCLCWPLQTGSLPAACPSPWSNQMKQFLLLGGLAVCSFLGTY